MDLAWVEQTSLSRFIALTPGVYPTLSALHILGIALLVGALVPAHLATLGLLRGAISDAVHALMRFAMAGFALAAVTGSLLATVQLSRYVEKEVFLVKLGLIALAGVNLLIFRVTTTDAGVRLAAAVSLTLWVCIVFAGRWIAFT